MLSPRAASTSAALVRVVTSRPPPWTVPAYIGAVCTLSSIWIHQRRRDKENWRQAFVGLANGGGGSLLGQARGMLDRLRRQHPE